MKGEKEKSFMAKLNRTIIHAPFREEEDVGTNPMMRRKRRYNHQSQSHAPPEVGGATDALVNALHMLAAFSFFFNSIKLKMPPRPINNHKQTMRKLPQNP
jgi:hypothetical protein